MANVFSLLPPDNAAMPVPMVAIAPAAASAPSLLHFSASQANAARPQIIFPPPNAAIEIDPGTAVALQATGGAAPYRWIIDGAEIPPPQIGDNAAWQPATPGFFRITVIDQQNQSGSETVQVR
jgi:penicillin-binding protein 1C